MENHSQPGPSKRKPRTQRHAGEVDTWIYKDYSGDKYTNLIFFRAFVENGIMAAVSPAEWKVLAVLYKWVGENNRRPYRSLKMLEQDTGLTKKTCIAAHRSLRTKGLISFEDTLGGNPDTSEVRNALLDIRDPVVAREWRRRQLGLQVPAREAETTSTTSPTPSRSQSQTQPQPQVQPQTSPPQAPVASLGNNPFAPPPQTIKPDPVFVPPQHIPPGWDPFAPPPPATLEPAPAPRPRKVETADLTAEEQKVITSGSKSMGRFLCFGREAIFKNAEWCRQQPTTKRASTYFYDIFSNPVAWQNWTTAQFAGYHVYWLSKWREDSDLPLLVPNIGEACGRIDRMFNEGGFTKQQMADYIYTLWQEFGEIRRMCDKVQVEAVPSIIDHKLVRQKMQQLRQATRSSGTARSSA